MDRGSPRSGEPHEPIHPLPSNQPARRKTGRWQQFRLGGCRGPTAKGFYLPQSKARTAALERARRRPSLAAGVLATVAFIALDAGRQVPSLAPLLYVIGGSFLVVEAGFLSG